MLVCVKKIWLGNIRVLLFVRFKVLFMTNGRSILDLINGSFNHGLSFGGYRGRQISTLIIQLHKVGYKERANRVHISYDIVWLFWQFDILYCKKTCLSGRLSALIISWERYLAIVKRLEYKIIITKSRVNLLLLFQIPTL